MNSSVETEHVLVVPTALFHEIGHFQGFCGDVDRYFQPLLESEQLSYQPRDRMEQDPSYKQLIPYVIFRYDDEQGSTSVFRYTRGSGQGESRLHAKVSIGIGGHISSTDSRPEATETQSQHSPYLTGMQRELDEEVRIETSFEEGCVGLINDDETEVGRVHLGIVHVFQVAAPQVFANEQDIVDAGFQSLKELVDQTDRMETWSRYCFDALFR